MTKSRKRRRRNPTELHPFLPLLVADVALKVLRDGMTKGDVAGRKGMTTAAAWGRRGQSRPFKSEHEADGATATAATSILHL